MKRKEMIVWGIMAICLISVQMAGSAASAQPLNLKIVAGEWGRIDGDYALRVENVGFDGTADVGYFNPGPIHVAESRVFAEDGRIKLFVKLQDEGYPGSTYTLYYYSEKDVLAGLYYQAATGQTYEVIFTRKET
jgi:hypothetical protein